MAADTWINPFAGLTRKHGVKCRSVDGVGIESYVQSISETIGPKNIVAASRANGSVIIFLDSLKSVEEVCVVGMNDIGGTYISVDPLVKPATKVILSGVPPFIPNSVIEKELHRYGRIVSTIRIIPLGCKKPEFRHIKSFRRQVYMLGNEEHIQGVINFDFEDRQYRIYLSTDEVTCYKCFKKGHIQRNCRRNIEQEQPAAGVDQNNRNLDQNTTDENTNRTDKNDDKTTRDQCKQTTNQIPPDPDQLNNTRQTHSNANDTTETTSSTNTTTDSTGVTDVADSLMSIDASPDVALQTANQNAPDPDDQLNNTRQTHSNANDTTETTSSTNHDTTDSTGFTDVDDSPMSIDASPDAEENPPKDKGLSSSVWAVDNDKRTTILNKEEFPPLPLSTPDLNAICMESQSSDYPTESNAAHAGGSQNSEIDNTKERINATTENHTEMTQEYINEERVLTPPSHPEVSGEGVVPCIPHDVLQEPAATSDDDIDDVVSDSSDISSVSVQDVESIENDELIPEKYLLKFLKDSFNSKKLIRDAKRFSPNLELLVRSLTHMRKESDNISSKEAIRIQRLTLRIATFKPTYRQTPYDPEQLEKYLETDYSNYENFIKNRDL